MKNKTKVKKILIIVLVVLFLFVIYNSIWLTWRYFRYTDYTDNMEVFIENTSYIYTDEEGYDYNVKLPDYLTYTGNLCVAVPDGKYALIIWPNAFDGYEYGVQLEIDDDTYSIMLNEDFSAQDSQFDDIIYEYSETISDLYERSVNQWDI